MKEFKIIASRNVTHKETATCIICVDGDENDAIKQTKKQLKERVDIKWIEDPSSKVISNRIEIKEVADNFKNDENNFHLNIEEDSRYDDVIENEQS